MKNWIAVRPNNRLFNVLMFFIGVTFMLVWLPLLRCLFDGRSYSWGQWYFGVNLQSQGISAGYFILIPFLLLFLALFYSFYWQKNRIVFYILLAWWWLHAWGNLLLDITVHGDTMFHGDTLNVHVSLSAIVMPLAVLALVLILLVIKKDKRMETVSIPWGASNRNKALVILAPLVLQAIFFATGEPHGTTDEIAVIMAIMQALFIPIIFYPAKKS